MYKKIIQSLILICAAATTTLAALLWKNVPTQDVYLDATNFEESDESKEFRKNNNLPQYDSGESNIENSFLTENLDNYGLYLYDGNYKKEGHHLQEQLKFSGNISSYDLVRNDAMNLSVWNNDFAVANLVIKTKNNFSDDDSLTVQISNSNEELSVQSGYLRYIVADQDETSPGWPVPGGVTTPLLVPDAITSNQTTDMYKNNVYIFRIRIDRKEKSITKQRKAEIFVSIIDTKKNNKIIDKKKISVDEINKDLGANDGPQEKDKPSFDILNYPTFMAYYYNNKGIDYNNLTYYNGQKQRLREEKGIIPPKLIDKSFNENNRINYIDWNWKEYWEPEFKYHHDNFGETNFMVDFLHDGNHRKSYEMNNDGKLIKSNLWDEDRDGNSWYIMKIKDGKIVMADDDWEAMDDYIYKMGSIGFSNIVFNSFLKMAFYTSLFYVWNGSGYEQQMVTCDFTKEEHSLGNDQSYNGYDLRVSMIENYIDHIKELSNKNDYKYNWVKDFPEMGSQFYIDESSAKDVYQIVKIFKQVENESQENLKYKRFLKTEVAFPIWEMRTDLKWPEEIKDVDILYTNTFHIYNDDFAAIKDLVKDRDSRNLVTGIYQLSGSANFDMLKANPAVLMYEMMILNKQKEPHYMKYMMARWQDLRFQQNSYYYGTYWEQEFFSFPDVSGNVSWEYPFMEDLSNFDYTKPIEVNPSVRLEGLAQGANLAKKVNILATEGKLNIDTVNNNINMLLSGSKTQSRNRFCFNKNTMKFNVPSADGNDSISYIELQKKADDSAYGQTDAVKWIYKLVEQVEKN